MVHTWNWWDILLLLEHWPSKIILFSVVRSYTCTCTCTCTFTVPSLYLYLYLYLYSYLYRSLYLYLYLYLYQYLCQYLQLSFPFVTPCFSSVLGSDDGMVRVWSLSTNKATHVLQCQGHISGKSPKLSYTPTPVDLRIRFLASSTITFDNRLILSPSLKKNWFNVIVYRRVWT